MLQLRNHTQFPATMAVFADENGVDTLHIVAKSSFTFNDALTLAELQTPPQAADVYWSEPGRSSLKYASDMHIGKPATDIVMLGHACAPQQKKVEQLDVALRVGEVTKTVRAFGDRRWDDGRITPPQAFKTMPMVYEKAYGGVDIVDGAVASADTRNPVGCGYVGSKTAQQMRGHPLPNLEDPQNLIRNIDDRPAPAGFGFCAPNWQPRADYAGTYDDHWRRTRAPYLPTDFDRRFLNMAHPDLVYPGYLRGGEPIAISHMHPAGALQCELPRMTLVAHVAIADRKEESTFNLETLILEPNEFKFSMVWRASLPCDKQALKISEVTLALLRT